jgi:hypothetical protein
MGIPATKGPTDVWSGLDANGSGVFDEKAGITVMGVFSAEKEAR